MEKIVNKQKVSGYRIWAGMLQRCRNKRSQAYAYYGARGISVCSKWLTFDGFFEDMGVRPSSLHSIDRRDNDGNYEPGNCYWATKTEQANNTRKSIRVTFEGKSITLAELATLTGKNINTLRARKRLGFSDELIASSEKLKKSPDKASRARKHSLEIDGELLSVSQFSSKFNLKPNDVYRLIYLKRSAAQIIAEYL